MIIALVGPTATGKSELALDVAEALQHDVEIVSADAMQLYRGMDIGTAKLPLAERRGIPHHQLDVLEVWQEASVAAYQRHARADIAAICARGAVPLVVGGSGLYVRALLDEIDFPGTDPAVRARLEQEAAASGPAAAHARLAALDPPAAAQIAAANVRRVVRALEVIELTGRPFSAQLPAQRYHAPTKQFQIDVDQATLRQRIAARTDAMLAAGLLEETRSLAAQGLRESKTAARATGYAQALAVLDGQLTQAEAAAAITLATTQLARRQRKWFARDSRIHHLDPAGDMVKTCVQMLNKEGL
ncbi:tRNA (adenosine(37)-N6)-dimethylallyltransferase MiaA [Buchananella hordeovulneris]|uniref:tRNA (adenosine(37)-N6)-dimethylallyltransferase MiaA n=1 Tax=Buchananella hordeovulneris TaxID=52770 RepID=UPI0026DBD9B4|nr:tRNA (adenosine(37)-N6)-dimethylallyltransferase MiaA [Buchananella hordeovulneris]MDO5080938.1 tRNA (adenosine(37)-N6)-dimethylallyltransferase MiaA [Buchananella hordeovulneris]